MKEYIPVITDREELYDKCENMEQLFDKYYLPLLDKHYSKTYKLQQECEELKKQLNYLRSGEYYNQLRFERDMLENVVSNGELSKEDKEFIDMTNRNTELLEENQELTNQSNILQADKEQLNSLVNSCQEEIRRLKKQLENKNKQIEYLRRSIERKEDTIIDSQNEKMPYTNEYVCKLETQQKEFIEYMNKTIEKLECDDVDDEEMKGYLIQRIDTFKEILSKYQEIMGQNNG